MTHFVRCVFYHKLEIRSAIVYSIESSRNDHALDRRIYFASVESTSRMTSKHEISTKIYQRILPQSCKVFHKQN